LFHATAGQQRTLPCAISWSESLRSFRWWTGTGAKAASVIGRVRKSGALLIMAGIILLKLATAALAIACLIFGALTAKKGFTSMRDERIDETLEGPAAGHFAGEATALGIFVFVFGFFLMYALTLF
jgi:hypothetical protein